MKDTGFGGVAPQLATSRLRLANTPVAADIMCMLLALYARFLRSLRQDVRKGKKR